MRWVRALIGAIGLVACQSGPSGGDTSPGSSEDALCGGGATYENFAGPFLLNWCTGCHGSDLPDGQRQRAPLGVDFDTKAGIGAHTDAIVRRVVTERTMPPVGGPSDAERELLKEWIGCGMPGDDPYFDPGKPAHSPAPPEADTRACAAPRKALPAEILPRCSSLTLSCRDACGSSSDDEAVVKKCRENCVKADPTPLTVTGGTPVNCEACNLYQLLACAEGVGCHAQVAALMCCIESCKTSSDPSCADTACKPAIDSFGQCVYYRGEECLKDDGPSLGACYGR